MFNISEADKRTRYLPEPPPAPGVHRRPSRSPCCPSLWHGSWRQTLNIYLLLVSSGFSAEVRLLDTHTTSSMTESHSSLKLTNSMEMRYLRGTCRETTHVQRLSGLNEEQPLVSVPAGSCRGVPGAGSAAPGRASASAGGAASLCSPAPRREPAPPAGRWRTLTAPRRSPPPDRKWKKHSYDHDNYTKRI